MAGHAPKPPQPPPVHPGAAAAKYPSSVWDGSSPNRVGNVNRPPDQNDWNQLVAEIQAMQTELLASPWTAITPGNGWTNTANQANLAWKKVGNRVFLRGNITAGTKTDATSLGTLPSGYRPVHNQSFRVIAPAGQTGDADMRLVVGSDGTLKVYGLSTATALDLANISFFTDQ